MSTGPETGPTEPGSVATDVEARVGAVPRGDRGERASLVVCALVLGFAALHYFEAILAPVTFAVLIIALVWPVQRRLKSLVPPLVAVAGTVLLTLVGLGTTAWLAVWAISGVVRWGTTHADRLLALYAGAATWLEGMASTRPECCPTSSASRTCCASRAMWLAACRACRASCC